MGKKELFGECSDEDKGNRGYCKYIFTPDYTSTSEETVIREYSDAEGNPYQVEETVVKTTLHIEYTSMTASQGADVYHFNEKQREQLNTLLSSDFDELWEALVE